MQVTCSSQKNRIEQTDLFHRPPDLPTWDNLPEECRAEIRTLLARMFIALAVAGECSPSGKGGDHE